MSLPAPQRPRLIRVRRIQDVTPHLRRITFHSNELTDYPFTCGGAHIKLMFPQPGQRDPVLPTLTEQGPRWITREPFAYNAFFNERHAAEKGPNIYSCKKWMHDVIPGACNCFMIEWDP